MVQNITVCGLNQFKTDDNECWSCPRESPVYFSVNAGYTRCYSCADVKGFVQGSQPQIYAAYNAACLARNPPQEVETDDKEIEQEDQTKEEEAPVKE